MHGSRYKGRGTEFSSTLSVPLTQHLIVFTSWKFSEIYITGILWRLPQIDMINH